MTQVIQCHEEQLSHRTGLETQSPGKEEYLYRSLDENGACLSSSQNHVANEEVMMQVNSTECHILSKNMTQERSQRKLNKHKFVHT